MYNLILILLLINTIYSYFFGINKTVLYCGLFGFSSDTPKKFNWDKFNLLGLMNDSRGGDSCGRLINQHLEYGNGTRAKYKDYVLAVKNTPMSSNIAMGQTRRASSGGRLDKYSQPIGIMSDSEIFTKKYDTAPRKWKQWANKKLAESEEPFLAFAVTHNGTLVNHVKLAKEYDLDSKDLNDTTTLTHILFLHGDAVLEKYIGTAALIVWDAYYQDSIFIYHGESPNIEGGSIDSVERPLHFWKKSPTVMYFSSEEDPLLFIGGDVDTVDEVPTNKILKVTDGTITLIRDVDRSKAGQKEEWKSTRKSGKVHGYKGHQPDYDYDFDNSYADSYTNINRKNKFRNRKQSNIIAPYKFNNNVAFKDGLIFKFENEALEDSIYIKNRILYFQGYYWLAKDRNNMTLVTGKYKVTDIGDVQTAESKYGSYYYFFEGVLLRKEADLNLLLVPKHNSTTFLDNKLPTDITKILCGYSKYPIHTLHGSTLQDVRENAIDYYNGKYSPAFSKRTYHISNGDLRGITINDTFNEVPKEHTIYKATYVQIKFLYQNYGLCNYCSEHRCTECVIYNKYSKRIPDLKLDINLHGTTVAQIIENNKGVYFNNYDFCEGCLLHHCESCIVLDPHGTTIPTFRAIDKLTEGKIPLDSKGEPLQILFKSENEDIKDRIMTKQVKLFTIPTNNEGTAILGSEEDLSNTTVAKNQFQKHLDNIQDAIEEAEEELLIIGDDKLSNSTNSDLSKMKSGLTDIKNNL